VRTKHQFRYSRVANWVGELINMNNTNNKFLVIDCETGGLNPEEHSILSCAGVSLDINSGHIEEVFNYFIKESSIVACKEALKNNKINLNYIVECGLEPAEAVKSITIAVQREFGIGNQFPIIGHNVGFDISFLKRLFKISNQYRTFESVFKGRSIDTCSVFRFLQLTNQASNNSTSLTSMLNYAGITYNEKEKHTALGDAILTAKAFLALIKKFNKNKNH